MLDEHEALIDGHEVQCPWCFERVELILCAQEIDVFIEDCEVCCKPWMITVSRSQNGAKRIDVEMRLVVLQHLDYESGHTV